MVSAIDFELIDEAFTALLLDHFIGRPTGTRKIHNGSVATFAISTQTPATTLIFEATADCPER